MGFLKTLAATAILAITNTALADSAIIINDFRYLTAQQGLTAIVTDYAGEVPQYFTATDVKLDGKTSTVMSVRLLDSLPNNQSNIAASGELVAGDSGFITPTPNIASRRDRTGAYVRTDYKVEGVFPAAVNLAKAGWVELWLSGRNPQAQLFRLVFNNGAVVTSLLPPDVVRGDRISRLRFAIGAVNNGRAISQYRLLWTMLTNANKLRLHRLVFVE